ncbi:4-aminobutyrate aminotransferase [Salinarimonas soli]|uniref:4-aminobutyrate aminotransferase n=1 Tax=Salinarimonas soli TaxID=1638099 RepID=A0A5B2VEP7_9HYPH|nr:4-aminobutyrate aminotransferase [Salinarimonas soli]KAA2238023.1 4-aminobutyrate aminotransferase [Salinarimonas soli]
MIRPLSVLAVSTLILAAGPALAQDRQPRSVEAQPGKSQRLTMVGNVSQDCKPGALPAIKLVQTPRNGSLTVRTGETPAGQLKRCPALKVPVLGVFYEANAGFTGGDEVVIEVRQADGKVQTQTIKINVSNKPAAEPKSDAVEL